MAPAWSSISSLPRTARCPACTFIPSRKIVATAGETVVVPAGKVHDFANAGAVPAHVRVTISPALKMEEMFETTVSLAEEGKVMKSGMPKPMELALFVREFKDEARAPFPPLFVVRAVTAPLAAIAKRRGRNCRYRPADCTQAVAAAA
jgi:hypothetical protein